MLNALRAGMAEFGIVTRQGLGGATEILSIACSSDERLPTMLGDVYKSLADAIRAIKARLVTLDQQIAASTQFDETCKRLSTIPGVGPVTSTTIIALAGDVSRFPSGRDFAAWLGLTPRQHSTGGKARLGCITKAGDQTLRTLLVLGAFSVIRRARVAPERASPWLLALMERRPPLVAAVAFANKTARIIWAILTRGGAFRTPARAA